METLYESPEQTQATIAEAHKTLKGIDTTAIGQPHRSTLENILGILLHVLPVIAGLFHHATGQPPIILPTTTTEPPLQPLE